MLLFPLKFPNKKRKRVKNDASAPDGPVALAVVSVQKLDDITCLWTFTRTVASVANTDGLNAGGDVGDNELAFAGNTITIEYADPIDAGGPWLVVPENVDITFDPPGTLLPQGGLIS